MKREKEEKGVFAAGAAPGEPEENAEGPPPSAAEIRAALCQRHGEAVQEKLEQARVAVAGLGGLGSNVAFALARIGVGHLHLVDFDRVDLTNLNRQQYFIRHLGLYKTDALRQELLDINPYLDVRTDCVKVTAENLQELFAEDEIICEAFDVAEQKAFPAKRLVAASGMAGFGDSNRIHTRKVTKNFYLCGDEETESAPGAGLMAPRVAVCAAHEANMIVRLILGDI